ncbi:hypothetical protein O71_08927 [Pontibacter sp. BAB1700]|nr:hypothetical protein O71_08927 [Pontibacter sp. BAB1700]
MTMKKLSLLLVVLVGVVTQAFAQQRPQYSQYMVNNFLLNPALSGIEDYADIRISNRQQWVGLDGAPVTYYASAHMPLNKGAASTKYAKRSPTMGQVLFFIPIKQGPCAERGYQAPMLTTYPLRAPSMCQQAWQRAWCAIPSTVQNWSSPTRQSP